LFGVVYLFRVVVRSQSAKISSGPYPTHSAEAPRTAAVKRAGCSKGAKWPSFFLLQFAFSSAPRFQKASPVSETSTHIDSTTKQWLHPKTATPPQCRCIAVCVAWGRTNCGPAELDL